MKKGFVTDTSVEYIPFMVLLVHTTRYGRYSLKVCDQSGLKSESPYDFVIVTIVLINFRLVIASSIFNLNSII